MNYAVRITFSAEKLARLCSRLTTVSERVCLYEHHENVSNIHCHLILWKYQGDIKNIKRWTEEALNLKIDKTKISIKSQYKPKGTVTSIPIDEGAISYASKGKYDPSYVTGWSKEEIEALKVKGFDKKDKPVKLSGDLAFYSEWEQQFIMKLNVPMDEVSWYDIRANAVSYCFHKLQVVNANFKNKVKMCVQTYCLSQGIKVPDAEKKYHDF